MEMQGAKQKHGHDRANRLLPGISKLQTAAEVVDAEFKPSSKMRLPILLDAVQDKDAEPMIYCSQRRKLPSSWPG